MNLRVIKALLLKQAFIYSRSTFRTLDLFFWPVMDLLIWGFVTVYMLRVGNTLPSMVTFFISAAILWNVLYRAHQVMTVGFLTELWARNLLNIFASPIRPREYVAASYIMGLTQAVIVVVLLGTLANMFYHFNLLTLGLPFAFLFANLLLNGWWLGLFVTGCILRWGPPAEALAWALPSVLQPISAVFYPVSVLPQWLHPAASVMPASYVFEGMRQIIEHGHIAPHYLWCAFGLNVVYMILSAATFSHFFEQARRKGYLVKYAA